MAPRIAIPMPHGSDLEYAQRAIRQYERAIELSGAEPVRLALDVSDSDFHRIVEDCDGILLPGSKADVDPARFHATAALHTAASDPQRERADNLLLDDAFRQRKPVLGICYGLQSLNVYRSGSLVQHIPDFLPEATRGKVDHEAGKKVAVAHRVGIEPDSMLAKILSNDSSARLSGRAQPGGNPQETHENVSGQKLEWDSTLEGRKLILPVNSSHHQSADAVGDDLRIVARCPEDAIIEALEGTSSDHFVLALQWHPERSIEEDEASRAIFRALINAAAQRAKG